MAMAMVTSVSSHGAKLAAALLLTAPLLLSGCSGNTASAAIEAERAKPLQRYDIVQALAANGQVTVGASQAGAVVVSADEGKTWRRMQLGPVSIIGLATCPDGSFVGIDFNRKVWSADPQGDDWKSVDLEKPRPPLAVTCDGLGRWWVAGSGARIAVSADRGAHWTVTDLEEDMQLTTIQFVDDSHGFALGEFGNVVATEDGGASWQRVTQIPEEFYPYAAIFIDRNEGFVSGIAGQMLGTQDGGRTWSRMENRSGVPLYRLFLHDGQPHGVGGGGVIARLDGGVWQPVSQQDAIPVFLGAGAHLKAGAVVVGGPGGLIRSIATTARKGNAHEPS